MSLLTQFLLRLSFGLAVGMAVTSPRQVSSGYFRNHLYVTLGLTTLAAVVASQFSTWTAILATAAAAFSYAGSACWLYEAKRAGVFSLWLVASLSLGAALVDELPSNVPPRQLKSSDETIQDSAGGIRMFSVATSGFLLGVTTAAMLLSHWYLNSPGMELAPLRKLLQIMTVAVVAQIIVSAAGLYEAQRFMIHEPTTNWLMLVLLRWSFGLVGIVPLIYMAWQTLQIPNTQSATGILYVAVIGVFVGELASLLLSAQSTFPL